MAAPIRPASAKTYGAEKWVFVPTIADTDAPTVAEVTAVSGLDISCYLFGDSGRPTQSTNRVTAQRRICDTAVYERIGDTTYAGGELLYALDPQAAAGSDGKKAWETLPAGTTGYLVRRFGLPVATDFAAGQFVDAFPVELGPAMPTASGDGEAGEVAATQAFAVTGPPAFVKAIAAAA